MPKKYSFLAFLYSLVAIFYYLRYINKRGLLIMPKLCRYESDFKNPDLLTDYHWYNGAYQDLHIHNYWELFLITDGKAMHRINDIIIEANVNDIFLIRPDDCHCLEKADQNFRHINFMITTDVLRNVLDVFDISLYQKLITYKGIFHLNFQDENFSLFFDNIKTLYTLSAEDLNKKKSLIKFQFLYIINELYNTYTFDIVYPDWLNNFLKELRKTENLSLRISELTKLTNYSYSHLLKLFKKYLNENLVDYLRRIRMDFSINMLETTDLSVLTIASIAGYDSVSHFTKTFKEYFEILPGEYKQLCKRRMKK